MSRPKQKTPFEAEIIVCTCGRQIVFANRKGVTKPRYITCRNCKKKHFL